MKIPKDLLVADNLVTAESDEASVTAAWGKLTPDQQATYQETSLMDRLTGKLVGDEGKPGPLVSLISGSLERHTAAVNDNLLRAVNEALDKRGVKHTPGYTPPKPVAGDPTPVIPPDSVPRAEYNDAMAKLMAKGMRDDLGKALPADAFMNDAARQDALDWMAERAKDKDGVTIVAIQATDSITKKPYIQELHVDATLEHLKKVKSFLFKAAVPGGTGGGGGEPGSKGGGPDPLPSVTTYSALLDQPDLLGRFMKEKPEEFRKLKEAHFQGDNNELGAVLSGKGLSTQTLVAASLAKLRGKLSQPSSTGR